jgi:cystathionine gamma-synthase
VSKKLNPASVLVSAGRPHEPGEPLNTPLVPASNFLLGANKVYAREDSTASWLALEEIVGALEGGQALAYASGMAAAAAVFALVPPGGSVVLPEDCYQGVAALAGEGAQGGRWQLRKLPAEDTAGWVAAAARDDLLWLESPSNPLLILADLATICAAPRKAGTRLAVDNTFATPLNQRPLALGADVSMHSATKFIGGHSDLLGGLLITPDKGLYQQLRRSRQVQGATPGTLEAWLATRGLRTLELRLRRAEQNALLLAQFLQQHPRVTAVRYPGLSNHPQHALAAAQLDGFGAIISFEVRGGAQAAEAVCAGVTLMRHATSLGSVESTIERRAAYPGQQHLPASLLRVSVGIEAIDDLIDDMDQALQKSANA